MNDLKGHSRLPPLLPFDISYFLLVFYCKYICLASFEILTLIYQKKTKMPSDLDHAHFGDSL